MAEDKAAQPLLGLAEASDYLAQLLARLDRLGSGAGLPLTLSLEEPLSDLLDTQAEPQTLYFGTPLEYGAAHQFGRPEINLPERPYLGLSEADQQSVLETLEGYLMADAP